jgi:succinate dehydrogenase flavin-adding protein (antitoxin of CptAB toxin-antitoxin module)
VNKAEELAAIQTELDDNLSEQIWLLQHGEQPTEKKNQMLKKLQARAAVLFTRRNLLKCRFNP